ncbi:hypothetical protein [Musicola keenii]|uniref:hypothetical protein n=1 Tax=Musicola keenii TaxID=2884250 RepID=UPI00177E8A7C|nr:hypothetical protein [Musicola keenii]
MATQLAGGWTPFHDLDATDKSLFETVVGRLLGVHYTPLFVATQVVNGTNYSFLTKAVAVYPEAPTKIVKVYVYQPLKGDAHITAFEDVPPQHTTHIS